MSFLPFRLNQMLIILLVYLILIIYIEFLPIFDVNSFSFCACNSQPYQPDYTAPPPRPQPEETTIDIG